MNFHGRFAQPRRVVESLDSECPPIDREAQVKLMAERFSQHRDPLTGKKMTAAEWAECEAGESRQYGAKRVAPEAVLQIVRYRLRYPKVSYGRIGELFGVAAETACKYCRRAGVPSVYGANMR